MSIESKQNILRRKLAVNNSKVSKSLPEALEGLNLQATDNSYTNNKEISSIEDVKVLTGSKSTERGSIGSSDDHNVMINLKDSSTYDVSTYPSSDGYDMSIDTCNGDIKVSRCLHIRTSLDNVHTSPVSSTHSNMSADNTITSIESDDRSSWVTNKRGYEYLTIEGSPFIQDAKRLDSLPTPLSLRPSVPLFPQSPVFNMNSHTDKKIATIENSTDNANIKGGTRVVSVLIAGGEHDTGSHQENFRRLALLADQEIGCLNRPPLKDFIEVVDTYERKASLADLLRVHDYGYLNHLENKVKAITSSEVNTTMPVFYALPGQLDNDTPLGPSSLDAAKKFCGAAMTAVDIAMDYRNNSIGSRKDRILVLGRPPGHHAGSNGCVVSKYYSQKPDMASSGFCLLNTVAVAAAYARYKYGCESLSNVGTTIRSPKIAIIDIDIHHGNGTEEIVRNLKPRHIHLPLPSSWAPISQFVYKPWLNEDDSRDIFFSSINLIAGDRFYPCSGEECDEDYKNNIVNISLTPIGPGPWDQRARSKLSKKDKSDYILKASTEFRTKVSEILLPRLRKFQPDLILISAGFDAHVDDYYHFLIEDDYYWITHELVTISEEFNGSVISILEGGYSLSSEVIVPSTTANRSLRNNNKSSSDLNVSNVDNTTTKYAQQSGDGGLVKGVLAHTAALAGKKSWVK